MTDQHTAHEGQPHEQEPQPSKLMTPVACVILLILALYGAMLYQGVPQEWTSQKQLPC
jgi:hypothetical protein